MRAFAVLLSLGFFASAIAAPAGPALFAKDPLSVHKRAAIPEGVLTPRAPVRHAPEPMPVRVAAPVVAPADVTAESAAQAQPEEEEGDVCAEVCAIKKVEGARNEREALCSVQGLRSTLECAQCIDVTWPDTTWDDSAMAEYERIVLACEDVPQVAFRHPGF